MKYLYKILEVHLPPHQSGIEPILIATTKELPKITGILNHSGNDYNTFVFLDGEKKADIAKGFKQGFSFMLPLYLDMKRGQVLSVGFYNHTVTLSTCRIMIQYYLA